MNSKKDCAGTYPVSGYVRKDGTEVSAYMRTCGAKHEGGINYLSEEEKKYIRKKEECEYIKNNLKYAFSFSPYQEMLAKSNLIDISMFKYYSLSLDFENQKQFNTDNSYQKLQNINDIQLCQLIKNTYIDIDDNSDVVIPQFNTELYNFVMNSDELKRIIKNNYIGIEKGLFKNKIIDINFNDLVLGKAKLYNMRVVDDYICGTLVDYYDFDELSAKVDYKNILKTLKSVFYTEINNNAYYQQEVGRLHNYLILLPIRIPVLN